MKLLRFGALFGFGAALSVAGFLAACSDTSLKSASIGAIGGTVTLADGTSIAIGPGAVSSPTNVTAVVDDSAPAPAGATAVGHTYRFGPEGQTFLQAVAITLAVDLDKLPSGKTIADVLVYTAPAGSSSYTVLATTVADAQHVRAATGHFSEFLPALAVAPPNCDSGTHLAGNHCVSDSDMSVAGDLSSSPIDLAYVDSGPCTQTNTGGGGTCTRSSTCGGHDYHLVCTNTACNCTTDGISTHAQFQAASCASAWTTCAYP